MRSKTDWVIYFLILGSIITWSYSILRSTPQMGNFGIINSLSPYYFVSMALLLGSFILALIRDQNKKIFFIIIWLLVVIIFLTPSVIEQTARFRFSYKVYGFAEYIIRTGIFDPKVIWYHDWPGSFIWITMLSDIIKPNDDFLFLTYFPFIIQILYFFPLYVILKTLFRDHKKIWIGVWIFYIINFINQDYMSPQAFAYLYYLIMLSIILKLANVGKIDIKNYDNNIPYKLISIILISGLVITHALTPMIILSIIIFAAILFNPSSVSKKNLFKFAFALSIIMTAWIIYGAYVYLGWHLFDFFQNSINSDSYTQNVQQRVSGSPAHLIISKLMIGTTLISVTFAGLGIMLSYLKRDNIFKTDVRIISMMAAIMALAKSPYGGEMIMRIFLFMLPFLSFFIAQILDSKLKIILIAFIVIMTPLNLITHYGNEAYDHVSKAELDSYDFYYKNVDNRNVTGGYPLTYWKYAEQFNYVEFKEFKDLKWNGSVYITKTGNINNMMLSKGDKEQLAIFDNDSAFIKGFEYNLTNSKNYVKMYSNKDVNLYNINN